MVLARHGQVPAACAHQSRALHSQSPHHGAVCTEDRCPLETMGPGLPCLPPWASLVANRSGAGRCSRQEGGHAAGPSAHEHSSFPLRVTPFPQKGSGPHVIVLWIKMRIPPAAAAVWLLPGLLASFLLSLPNHSSES